MDTQHIKSLMSDDLLKTDALIHQSLGAELPLIEDIGNYIVDNGGKRLRPLLVLLVSRALGYEGEHHLRVAAIIELIHTATLMHDDVVDKSTLRRGHKTANNIWGNAISVLTGDFLYSRAFQLMVEIDKMRVLSILADASNLIATGEVEQLASCHNANTSLTTYMSVIEKKTAKLFEAACLLPAVLKGAGEQIENQLKNYGKHIGIAFQLIDDVLDYTADEINMGKHLGDDLAEGKPTLPIIHALSHGNSTQKKILTEAIEQGKTSQLPEIVTILHALGSIDYTYEKSLAHAKAAEKNIDFLPESAYKEALMSLTTHAVERVT